MIKRFGLTRHDGFYVDGPIRRFQDDEEPDDDFDEDDEDSDEEDDEDDGEDEEVWQVAFA